MAFPLSLRATLFTLLACALGCGGGGGSSSGQPAAGGTTIAEVYAASQAALQAGFPDTDGDAIPDEVETTLLHTSPVRVDTDGDGLFDHQEVFGDGTWGETDPLPDQNHDGQIAALDQDDDGDGTNDGEGVDSDGDGIPNYLEFYGYTWNRMLGKPQLWDGNHAVAYYKTDYNQASTDQDPFDDAMEVSGTNMDVSVTGPGDLPMVPALPEIVVRLEGYRVTSLAEITVSESQSIAEETTWESQTTTMDSRTSEHGWGVEIGAEVGFEFPGVSASVSVTANYSGSIANTHETTTCQSRGGSLVSTQEWSRAKSMQPSRAAAMKLFLKVYNRGTACASNVVPTLSLRVGGHNVATFQPGATQVNLLEPGGSYPAAPGVYWVVDTNQNGEPIALTIDELKALECGAPVSLTLTQMSADVMRKDDQGAYQRLGDWNEYIVRCKAVCADLYFDIGDGNYTHSLVYADDSPTATRVTLGDAFLWGVGGTLDQGLGVTYKDMEGLQRRVDLAGWKICVDGGTYEANGLSRDATQLPEGFNFFDLRLNPNSVIVAKAPRASVPTATEEPDIYYAYYDSGLGGVNAVVGDYNGIESVEFVDSSGVRRAMSMDLPGAGFYVYYPQADSANYPDGYAFTGTEKVRVTSVSVNPDTGEKRWAEQTLQGIYVPPRATPPTIQWAYVDKVSDDVEWYMVAEVQPGQGSPVTWVKLFPADIFETPITFAPVPDAFRRPYCWMAKISAMKGKLDTTELVAYSDPGEGGSGYYASLRGPFPEVEPYNVGQVDLWGYHGWYGIDEWHCQGVDLETDATTSWQWEYEGFPWDIPPGPPGNYDAWLYYDPQAHGRWELRLNSGVLSAQVLDLTYEELDPTQIADRSGTLTATNQWGVAAGQVYILRTSSGRSAKLTILEAVEYDPGGVCNRGMRLTFKWTVYP